MNKTICFTGHRRIGGRYVNDLHRNKIYTPLREAVARAIDKGFDHFISGGALGTDQVAAQVVLDLGAKLTIARPFPSQACKWPQGSVSRFERLCSDADQVIDVSPDPFSAKKMQVRNQWMVDHSQTVIAVFDGHKGGTFNCIQYALKQGRLVLTLNPNTNEQRWIK